jgi:hypothetical protein
MRAFLRSAFGPLFLSLACGLLVWLDVLAARWLNAPGGRPAAPVEPAPQRQTKAPAEWPLSDFERGKPALGEAAPDFTLRDVEGKPFRLSDLAGRVPVLIEFGSFT